MILGLLAEHIQGVCALSCAERFESLLPQRVQKGRMGNYHQERTL